MRGVYFNVNQRNKIGIPLPSALIGQDRDVALELTEIL